MALDDEKLSRSREQTLVPCCFKKRTRRDIPLSSSSQPSNFSLNDLQVLLIEVLQRLPTTKSAFLCKCICKNWEWRLEDQVYLDALVLECSLVQEIGDGAKHNIIPLGFHPSGGDVAYLNVKASVISCNAGTKELKMAGKIPGITEFDSRGCVFHSELPLWPTPIATPVEILPC